MPGCPGWCGRGRDSSDRQGGSSQPPAHLSEAEQEKAGERWLRGRLERLGSAGEWKRAEKLQELASPYHELFADAVAVFYFRQPDAIAGPSAPLSPTPEERSRTELRHFGRRHTNRSTRAVDPGVSHGLGAPIRSLLWRTYQGRLARGEPDPRPAILRALARATAAEVDERLRTGRPIRSVARFNRDLRRRLLADPEFTGRRAR